MRKLFPTILLLSLSSPTSAQSGLDLMDVDLMFVGAHPDDDSGVLATFARYVLDEGFKATVVTATGGDGGGNAIGPEAGRSLALIRKEEERRALALVGVDSPSFLGLTDFYFTLSAEETEQKWGASFVCDVVRSVRLQRPEVIITMWPGPGTHGQHQMAARAATIAYAKASDPEFCPELTTLENLSTFQPLKLYYYNRESPVTVEIPTDDFSRALNVRYADIRALGMSKYRSQGFDQFLKIPVDETRPEQFMLVRSMVPVASPETHLLEGALLAAGSSPAGVVLQLEPASYEAGIGIPVEIRATLTNGTSSTLGDVALELEPPEGVVGWSVAAGEARPAELAPGERTTRVFHVSADTNAAVDKNVRVRGGYAARLGQHSIGGANYVWLRATAPVRARFQPLYDVAGYRDFARETKTEWVIETLPARLPLVIGRTNTLNVELTNTSSQRSSGSLSFDVPSGVSVHGPVDFEAAPGETVSVAVELDVDETILPEGRHSVKVPLQLTAAAGASTSTDTGDIYALPSLEIPRVASPPNIDADLADMEGFAQGAISPTDLWWRREPESAMDSSATFSLAYDERFLYVGIRVMDDAVVCNIAPHDVRAQLRSDAIGITIDPSGGSRDTSTVMQAAAFPCTTDGFGARGFRDADANQGLMEDTAPGMEVASKPTDDGYTLEARIPWAAMPQTPSPGDEIALNIIVYDGDLKDARVGANISESGLGWAAFPWGGKQALPYLWPRVVLLP
jgi:LmbE family N-acetylglucosaminyl deacetylase